MSDTNAETVEFPPLTSLVEYPLHPTGIYDEHNRWACLDPESPTQNVTAFDWRCPACVIAAQATIVNQGDRRVSWRQSADDEDKDVTLSWLVARAVYWAKRRDAVRPNYEDVPPCH